MNNHEQSTPFPPIPDRPVSSPIPIPSPPMSVTHPVNSSGGSTTNPPPGFSSPAEGRTRYQPPPAATATAASESTGGGGSVVHPGQSIFNFGGPVGKNIVSLSESEGGTTFTDVLESRAARQQQQEYGFPFMSRQRGGQVFFPMGPGLLSCYQMNDVQDNEKYQQIRKKKEKRAARKAEKNVKVMKKAEDVEGYRGDAVIDDILQSLGESIEEKKGKMRKSKDSRERKDKKRKSVDKPDESQEEMKETETEEVQENANRRSPPPPEKQSETGKPQLEDKQKPANDHHLASDALDYRSLRSSESNDSLNFVKVTGKKNKPRKPKDVSKYPRKSKEDTGRPPPSPEGGFVPPGARDRRRHSPENRRTSNYILRSREVPLSSAEGQRSESPGGEAARRSFSPDEAGPGEWLSSSHRASDAKQFALNTSQDFPALLPGNTEATVTAGWAGENSGRRMAAAAPAVWPRPSSSDPKAVMIDISGGDAEMASADADAGRKITTEAAAADVTAIAAAVEASVADESKLRDKDQAAETAVSGKEANCDTNEKYSAYVNQEGDSDEDKFCFDTRTNPVVAEPAEEDELSFGFEVNEELVSLSLAGEILSLAGDTTTAPASPLHSVRSTPNPPSSSPSPDQSARSTPRPASPPRSGRSTPRPTQQPFQSGRSTPRASSRSLQGTPRPDNASIEDLDPAILSSFSAADTTDFQENARVAVAFSLMGSGLPPPFGTYIPQVADMSGPMLESALCQDNNSSAVSPESGISSASPLSWQVEESPSTHGDWSEGRTNTLDQDLISSPPLQPGSYPRNKKREGRVILQEVNFSLQNWTRNAERNRSLKAYDNSVSSDESGARELSGYSGGEGEECKAYNYIDIVGFLLQSWSDATRDTKHKVYDENRK